MWNTTPYILRHMCAPQEISISLYSGDHSKNISQLSFDRRGLWLVLEMLSRGNCRHWLGLITRKLDTPKSPIVHVVSQTGATCLELTAVTNILLDMQQFYIRSLHALQFMIEKIKIDIIKFRVQILSTEILSSFVTAFRRDILIIDKVWAGAWNAPYLRCC